MCDLLRKFACSILANAVLVTACCSISAQSKEEDFKVHRIQWILGMLRHEPYQKKFDLTEDQVQKITKAREKITTYTRNMMRGGSDDKKTYREKIAHARKLVLEHGQVLDRVLVKHQLDTINYVYHMNFVRNRVFFGLTDPFVVSRLHISKTQAKELKSAAKEAQAELEKELEPLLKEIVAIKKKHLEEVFKILTPEQRKSYLQKFGIR